MPSHEVVVNNRTLTLSTSDGRISATALVAELGKPPSQYALFAHTPDESGELAASAGERLGPTIDLTDHERFVVARD